MLLSGTLELIGYIEKLFHNEQNETKIHIKSYILLQVGKIYYLKEKKKARMMKYIPFPLHNIFIEDIHLNGTVCKNIKLNVHISEIISCSQPAKLKFYC